MREHKLTFLPPLCISLKYFGRLHLQPHSRLTRFLSVCVQVLGSLQNMNNCLIVSLMHSKQGQLSPRRNVTVDAKADSSPTVMPMHQSHRAWACCSLVPFQTEPSSTLCPPQYYFLLHVPYKCSVLQNTWLTGLTVWDSKQCWRWFRGLQQTIWQQRQKTNKQTKPTTK